MEEELPPVMAGAAGEPAAAAALRPDAAFSKASIKAKFKAIRWSSFRRSKHKRPAVLQEVRASTSSERRTQNRCTPLLSCQHPATIDTCTSTRFDVKRGQN